MTNGLARMSMNGQCIEWKGGEDWENTCDRGQIIDTIHRQD